MIRILLLTFFLAVLLTYPVLAQDATPSTTRKERPQQKIEARRDRVENKTATREAALKAKLLKFKDKRKAEIAERVNTNLNKINQKQTAQMLKHLDKMSVILDKLEARNPQAAPASARAKIASATAAVKLQAEKDYTLTVTLESKVRADAQTLRNQLHTDLQSVRKQVIEAKQSVANAIRGAKSGQ